VSKVDFLPAGMANVLSLRCRYCGWERKLDFRFSLMTLC